MSSHLHISALPSPSSIHFCPYSSPLTPIEHSPSSSMGGDEPNSSAGVSDIQEALNIARNAENGLDPAVSAFLETKITQLWGRIQANPDTYVLTKDEFAVFNYFASRYDGFKVAEDAISRYWSNHREEVKSFFNSIINMRLHHKDRITACPASYFDGTTTQDESAPILKHRVVADAPYFNKKNVGLSIFRYLVIGFAAFLTISLFSFSMFWPYSVIISAKSTSQNPRVLAKHSLTAETPLLQVLQVYPPVLTIGNHGTPELTDGSGNASLHFVGDYGKSCQQTLAVYSFGYSYGTPFVGNYTPPTCDFNRITWNLTVTSAGRQYDRLGMIYLGDIEVFRTTTAEPTSTGIEWVYLKDMTAYSTLFREPQKIIFELDNIVDSTYTGSFNVTLTATYFTATDSISPADVILPISARKSADDASSVFTVPSDIASNNLILPQNTLRAVFTVAATGQSEEEFWWGNVPSPYTDTFPQTGALYGYSPFREVQLYIDGELAGVAWPFPIVFTGGIVPGLWRPIVGIDVFDLREDEIDITPWLGVLCDGSSHNFTIKISGLSQDSDGTTVLSETTESYWLVTGKVFIWLDESNHTTIGDAPIRNTPLPSFQVSSSVGSSRNGTNETLTYEVSAQRELSLSSTIKTSKGETNATWHQSLSFSNFGNFTSEGNVQINSQNTNGIDRSSSGYAKAYSYPVWVYTGYGYFQDNFSITADIYRGKNVKTIGKPVFPTGLESFSAVEGMQSEFGSFQGANLATTQNGSATYVANETSATAYSYGSTVQDMVFSGLKIGSETSSGFPSTTDTELYHRYVSAVNSTVVEDEEALIEVSVSHAHLDLDSSRDFAEQGIREMLGRGPNV